MTASLDQVDLHPTDIVVSSHACGALTDLVLARAVAVRARVAVLPCCHDLDVSTAGALAGWIDGPLAIDVRRAIGLEHQRYRVWAQAIDGDITPKNRLLIGAPDNDLR